MNTKIETSRIFHYNENNLNEGGKKFGYRSGEFLFLTVLQWEYSYFFKSA